MDRERIYKLTIANFLGPVQGLLDDPSVSEVMINGPHEVYCERNGKPELTDLKFSSDAALMAAARNIAEYVGREFGGRFHSVDARLPDGSRVHMIGPPSSRPRAREGVCITIRKFKTTSTDQNKSSLDNLVKWGSMTELAKEFLSICVKLHKNIIIAGGAGTGKTTMLNALSSSIPKSERVVVIEDSSELKLELPHTIYLEAQPGIDGLETEITIRDLLVDSLRMRPDRIVVGEVRRGEALDLIQSMISGHAGAMTTVHASSPFDAASRLETLSLMNDVQLPLYVARSQVASAVDLVVQIVRLYDGTRRVKSITQGLGLDKDDRYQFRDLFVLETDGTDEEGQIEGELKPTGTAPTFSTEPFELGLGELVELTSEMFRPRRGERNEQREVDEPSSVRPGIC